MSSFQSVKMPLRTLFAAALMFAFVTIDITSAETPPETLPRGPAAYTWLDIHEEPLPFQDHATIQQALLAGVVISRKTVARGVAGTEKMVLEFKGTRFHAAFRSVNRQARPKALRGKRSTKKYRDAAVFESAAYELSQLLGIDRVPPAVLRTIDGQAGSIQIWLEQSQTEFDLIAENKIPPPDEAYWFRQRQIMFVFDSLIGNADRNQGNMMLDSHWTLWLIDHTRAFRRSTQLITRKRITRCDRWLWTALQNIDDGTIEERLEPSLVSQEISRLLKRRKKLVNLIQKLIDKNGEDAVLFDLLSPAEDPRREASDR